MPTVIISTTHVFIVTVKFGLLFQSAAFIGQLTEGREGGMTKDKGSQLQSNQGCSGYTVYVLITQPPGNLAYFEWAD